MKALFTLSYSFFSTLLFLITCSNSVQSQVLINKTGGDAHESSLFEVRSDNKGFLPPVMSTTLRKAISNPAEGLMVYDTSKQKMFVFTREGWKPLLFGIDTFDFNDPVKVNVPGLSAGGYMGISTGIYEDFAVAGVPFDNINGNSNKGSIVVFKKNNGNWEYFTKISPNDGAAGDLFGSSVAILNDFIFVGSPGTTWNQNTNEGAVYIYRIEDGIVQFHQKLRGQGGSTGDKFGNRIAVNKNDLVVGAPYDDIGLNVDQGSIHFFSSSPANTWVQYQKYFNPNGMSKDFFGGFSSIDSNKIAIGCEISTSSDYGLSQNAVFIMEKVEGVWIMRAKINQPDGINNREAFGYACNLKNDIVVVGAWLHDIPTGNKDRGAAYVFKINQNYTYNLLQKIAPEDLSPGSPGNTFGDYFGVYISRFNDKLLISANYEDLSAAEIDRGAVFLYQWNGTQFEFRRRFSSPQPIQTEAFGASCTIFEGDIIVGAAGRDNFAGAVYFITSE